MPTHSGSDAGSQRAEITYTRQQNSAILILRQWLVHVIARVADHPANRIDERLVWNWRFEGKIAMEDLGTVLIVGASASIGPQIVGAFQQASRRVIATFCTRRLTSLPPNVTLARLDVPDASDRTRLCRDIAQLIGGLGVVMLMPGLIEGRPLIEYSDVGAAHVMAVNFTGQALLIRDLTPLRAIGRNEHA